MRNEFTTSRLRAICRPFIIDVVQTHLGEYLIFSLHYTSSPVYIQYIVRYSVHVYTPNSAFYIQAKYMLLNNAKRMHCRRRTVIDVIKEFEFNVIYGCTHFTERCAALSLKAKVFYCKRPYIIHRICIELYIKKCSSHCSRVESSSSNLLY